MKAAWSGAPGGASFRVLLSEELARRCSRNPQYSLRAFAAALGVDHATLSQWLRGKRSLTPEAVERLGARLGLPHEVVRAHAERERLYPPAGPERPEVRQLAADVASLVADWWHFAILELVRLESFRPDSRWIARVLDLEVDVVNVALQRLLRLRLLEMAAPDRWIDRSGDAAASLDGLPTEALEKLVAEARRLAVQSLRDVPGALREHSMTTVAVDTARLAGAFERIARFRRELLVYLDEGGAPRDDVYQLEIHLFPVTRLRRGPHDDDTKE